MLPIYDKKIIQDYYEGFNSVDSEDFEPGFGCVVEEKTYPLPVHPESKCTLTEDELYWIAYYHKSEEERQWLEDQFLQSKGVDISPRQK